MARPSIVLFLEHRGVLLRRRPNRLDEPLQQWGTLAMGWGRCPCQFGQTGLERPNGFPRLLGPRVESFQHDLVRFFWLHHERQGLINFFKRSHGAYIALQLLGDLWG